MDAIVHGQNHQMSPGMPSMTALLGGLAIAGYQSRADMFLPLVRRPAVRKISWAVC
jgi:hypothetical protein